MKKLLITFLILLTITPLSSLLPASTSKTNKPEIDKETMEFWEKTLQYGTSEQKSTTLQYIKTQKKKQAEKIIIDTLKTEKNLEIKKLMINTLVEFTNQLVLPSILELFENENNDQIKAFALAKLGDLKYKQTYQYAVKYILSEDILLAEAALRALGDTEAHEAVDQLISQFTNEKRDRVRTQIILALANIKSAKSYDLLLSVFTNNEEKEIDRGFAATGLGYIKQRESYEILTKWYPEASPNIQMRIIDAIGNLGYADAADLLIEALKNDNENIRYYSIISIGKLNIKKAIEVLEYKKDFDPIDKVRNKAKEVLAELKGSVKEIKN